METMYKNCQTEQSAARQRQLEQGLLRCMLRRQYEEITVSDLCDEIGIPRKSFYRYFSGKDGALYALIDHVMLDYETYLMGESVATDASVRRYMERAFSYWRNCKPLLDAIAKSKLNSVLILRALEYSQRNNDMIRFLSREEKQLAEYANMFAVCGLMSIMLQWHLNGFRQSPEQMAEFSLRLLQRPLLSDTTE